MNTKQIDFVQEIEYNNIGQIDMMKNLLTFLAAKLALYSSETRPAIYSTNSSLENVSIVVCNFV